MVLIGSKFLWYPRIFPRRFSENFFLFLFRRVFRRTYTKLYTDFYCIVFISLYEVFLLIFEWSRVYFQRKEGHLLVSYNKSPKHILGDPMLTLAELYGIRYVPQNHTNGTSIDKVFCEIGPWQYSIFKYLEHYIFVTENTLWNSATVKIWAF